MKSEISTSLFVKIPSIYGLFCIIFFNCPSQSSEILDRKDFTHSQFADRVVVLKGSRRMVLMRADRVLKIFRIALGRYPKGHKQREGDGKTPEGTYTLDYKLKDSAFYRAIHISYPNSEDVSRAESNGFKPGGRIMIHGLPNDMSADDIGHPYIDWTQGCIAVTNYEMLQLWGMIRTGVPIEIHP